MLLTGKEIKQFFSSAKGVFIDRGDKYVFIDLENDRANIIDKPESEVKLDQTPRIIYSRVFDAVQTLEDEKKYRMSVVFNAILFENEEGETDLVITGDRY